MASIDPKTSFQPDYAIPPGETLREIMDAQSMTIESLALRIGMDARSLHRIFSGLQPIVPETSVRLEMVFGIPASFWNNLQAQYAETLARLSERDRLDEERRTNKAWIKKFPLSLMKKRKYIPEAKDETEIYRALLSFFGVTSKGALEQTCAYSNIAARRSMCFGTDKWHMAVWIRQGEREVANTIVEAYDANQFKKSLAKIRSLTLKTPEIFVPEMKNLCAVAGVRLALVPEIPKVPWNGATKWIRGRPLIILNLRGKGEDVFWFSFFHEASHVLHDDHRSLHVADNSDDKAERKADEFAAESLMPAKYNYRVCDAKTESEIGLIAQELGIAPGIVAGRYRHLTKKWNRYAHLIRKFKWMDA